MWRYSVHRTKEQRRPLAPSIFEENFIDDLFGFPMKEFDDMERKLYGRKANRIKKLLG